MNQRRPLLVILLIPLVGLVTIAVGLVWYLSAQSSASSIERLLEALSLQKVNAIKHQVNKHFSAIHLLNEQNAYLLTQGMINPNDTDAVQQLLWKQAEQHGHLGYFLFGKTNGDFVDVGVPLTYDLDLITERISFNEFGDHLLRSYAIDAQGQRQEILSEPMEYAFQNERWFKDALERRETFWTDVYSWESAVAKPQAIAVSSPVFGEDRELIGAVAIEYRLEQLDQLLRDITVDSMVSVFLIDDKNQLIASSVEGSHQIPSILLQDLDGQQKLGQLNEDSTWATVWNQQKYHLGLSSWEGDGELRWTVLTVVSEEIFLQDLVKNRRYAIEITLASWIVLIIFGIVLHFSVVHRPLNKLVFAVQRAEQGNLDQRIKLGNIQEFYLLSEAFNGMLKSLRRLYANLERVNEDLELQVQERTQELERLKDEAERQARTDPLTGILNRRGFQEVADRFVRLAMRNGHPLSLILIDIDYFKRINDTWGHDAGDLVLKRVAAVLTENLRASDLAARWGGEEFAILLADTGREGAYLFADRLRLAIMAMEIDLAGESLHITASFGVAEAPMPLSGLEVVLSRVDTALYRSKTEGRNRVTLDDHPSLSGDREARSAL